MQQKMSIFLFQFLTDFANQMCSEPSLPFTVDYPPPCPMCIQIPGRICPRIPGRRKHLQRKSNFSVDSRLAKALAAGYYWIIDSSPLKTMTDSNIDFQPAGKTHFDNFWIIGCPLKTMTEQWPAKKCIKKNFDSRPNISRSVKHSFSIDLVAAFKNFNSCMMLTRRLPVEVQPKCLRIGNLQIRPNDAKMCKERFSENKSLQQKNCSSSNPQTKQTTIQSSSPVADKLILYLWKLFNSDFYTISEFLGIFLE